MKNEKYLVAGRSGIGKSRICQELVQRGLVAEDGDKIAGLAGWVDLATNQSVTPASLAYVDETKTDWLWNAATLDNWLAQPGERFLCGSAGNDLEFFERFAKVFVLSANPLIHMMRLQEREGEYVKHPAMISKKVAEQLNFTNQALELGAVAIDAAQPPQKIVDEILIHIR